MPWRAWAVILLAGVVGLGVGLFAAGVFPWPSPGLEPVAGGVAAGLGAASLTCLLGAAGAARRERRGAAPPRRWCRECGAGVPEGAAVCAWCGSAELGGPGRGASPRQRAARDSGGALPVTAFSRVEAGVAGGWRSPHLAAAQDVSGLLRRWACVLLVFAGPAVAVATAAVLGPGPGALALLGALGAGLAVARWGPRAP